MGKSSREGHYYSVYGPMGFIKQVTTQTPKKAIKLVAREYDLPSRKLYAQRDRGRLVTFDERQRRKASPLVTYEEDAELGHWPTGDELMEEG